MVSFYEYLHPQKKNIVDMSELQLVGLCDQHNHVIENGRCNLCDILISSSRTKHCSVCNKERTTFRTGFQEQYLFSLVAWNFFAVLWWQFAGGFDGHHLGLLPLVALATLLVLLTRN